MSLADYPLMHKTKTAKNKSKGTKNNKKAFTIRITTSQAY